MALKKNAMPDFEAISYDPKIHTWKDVSSLKLPFESVRYDFKQHRLEVLDQLVLPAQSVFLPVEDVEAAYNVISRMHVRGAPLIATVALLGLCVDVEHSKSAAAAIDLIAYIRAACARLLESRPTAVNMRNEFARLGVQLDSWQSADRETIKKNLFDYVKGVYRSERRENDALLRHATICVEHNAPADGKLRVATICNTGALATCSFGTALGVVLALHWRGRLEECMALETRPYLQGARLTAFELCAGQVPHRLIADSMAAAAMRAWPFHAVLIGADQVAANGDTANKIGSYALAIAARHHRVPFYVVAPSATINTRIASGDEIIIEERKAEELKKLNGIAIAPDESPVWNPAFDVVPAELISAILTDEGSFRPADLKAHFEHLAN